MFALNLGQLNINEAELKAYIYQQLNDMHPYVGDSPISIKMAYTADEKFVVKMVFDHEAGAIEAQSTGNDIFNAISNAKSALIRSVHSLDSAMEPEDLETLPNSAHGLEKKTLH